MLKLGITGGIGSGKSIVSRLLTVMGIPVYIADEESKKLTDTSPTIRTKLIQAFGKDLYHGDLLDRKKLASIIFTNKENLHITNSIIHPEVRKHFTNWLDFHSSYPIVAVEAAIMFESGFNRFVDKTCVVYAPLEIRLQRVMARDNTSQEKVLERINNQMSDEDKKRLADYLVNNDEKESVIKQVWQMIEKLK